METATSISSNPRTVEDIYKDFKSRRSAIIRALTVDADLFFSLCDPEKENLCLYGYPNDTWEVNLPAEEVPPELPEPVLGINFARDGMQKSEWLSLVAVHSDAWLISVAFFHGARFNSLERKKLYSMINDIPTVFELVTQKHQAKEKQSSTNGNKSTNLGKRVSNGAIKKTSKASLEEEHENYKDEEDDERNDTTCGICNGMYKETEFWIECDICEKWFHGKCVKVSESRAHYIKQYKCPLCCSKKPR